MENTMDYHHHHPLLSQYSFNLPQKTFMMTMDSNPILQQPSSPPPLLLQPPSPPSSPSSLLTNELLINQLREIFPANIKSSCEESKFLSREDFRNHAAQAFPFIQFKLGNILSQYTEPTRTTTTTTTNNNNNNDDDDDDNDHEKHQQRLRLYRLLNGSKICNDVTGKENISWAKVDDTLKHLPAPLRKNEKKNKKKNFRKLKKITIATAKIPTSSSTKAENMIPIIATVTKQREDHADTRLGYRFGNMFAVKRYFTFGERMTQPGEIHIIQTSEVPILYYEVKPEYRQKFKNEWNTRRDFRNGRFDPIDQKFFKPFVLNPDKYYKIPENTVYVLLTAQKTLFALDRYDEEAFQQIIKKDFRWKNISLHSPNQREQELLLMQIPIHTTNVITSRGNNNKRKRKSSNFPSLDNETDWIYNEELKPPKIFMNQNGYCSGGGNDCGVSFQEDIKFIPQYFYFEEPVQNHHQQQQQQQLIYQSGGDGDGNLPLEMIPSPQSSTPIYENNIEVIPSLNQQPPPPPVPSSPPIHQDVFPTPSFYMDFDEISFPNILSPQQDQENKEEFDNMLKELGNLYENDQTVEATTTTTPPPPSPSPPPSPLTVNNSSLDQLICNIPPQQQDELNALMEEMNQYGLEIMLT